MNTSINVLKEEIQPPYDWLKPIGTLLNAGLYLVPIPPDKKTGKPLKGPIAVGWNYSKAKNNPKGYSNDIADFAGCKGFNFGLAHLPAKTVALDLDSLSDCLTLFDDLGLPLREWLDDPNRVEIQSGKANRGKLLYRLPDGVDSFVTQQLKANGIMVFELRNSSNKGTTVQDVIHGTHPDTGTQYKVIGDINNIPEIPEALQDIASHWDEWKPCFESALGINQEIPKIAHRAQQQGDNLTGKRSPIHEFNQANAPTSILIKNGYKQVGKNRFIRPGSSSKAPGIVILDDCKDGVERVYSHGGDVLNDGFGHDSFDCRRYLELGDTNPHKPSPEALGWSEEITEHNQVLWKQSNNAQQPSTRHDNVVSLSNVKVDAHKKSKRDAEEANQSLKNEIDQLPDFPAPLLNLPYGLGKIQDYIFNRMIYPSRATAGMAALAVMTHFSQKHITIDSFSGLGLNEQYMILATTTFGKEDIRSSIQHLDHLVNDESKVGSYRTDNDCIASLAWSAPASQQGLHKLLEENRAHTFLSDEFAEWLKHTANDGHKQQALGYFMQCYTKALGTVAPPNSVTNKYVPVKCPRVSVLATSTADAMMGAMTSGHATSGAYNRFVIFTAEQGRIDKRYEGQVYQPSQEVLDCIGWVQHQDNTVVKFRQEAWNLFKQIDSDQAEPLKVSDGVMAGRLSEQTIKMAAKIALSDRRIEISASDLDTAYEIRLGIYYRTRALIKNEGAMSDMHATGQAKSQLEEVLAKHSTFYKSRLPSFSRKYKTLSINEQNSVLTSLYACGSIEDVPGSKSLIKSNLYVGG